MIHDLPEVLTTDAFANLMGWHPGSVRRQCQRGIIPAIKIGSTWAIPRDLVFKKFIEMEDQLEPK